MTGVDLDAYCSRLRYSGRRVPTIDTLNALHRLHPFAIPFENLTTLLGESPALDLESLQRKMIQAGRGGYCFEHNKLFSGVLRALGFEVTGLAARVLWERTDSAEAPRTHMLLSVRLAGRLYLCDVGFGGLTLTAPLLLEAGVEQATPHEPFRVVRADDGFVLQAKLQQAWRSLYWFDLNEHLDVDFEVLNHFVATHPLSPFPSSLYAARTLEDRRLALRDGRFTVYHLDGTSERTDLATLADLRNVLTDAFAITLPEDATVDEALTRVLQVDE